MVTVAITGWIESPNARANAIIFAHVFAGNLEARFGNILIISADISYRQYFYFLIVPGVTVLELIVVTVTDLLAVQLFASVTVTE